MRNVYLETINHIDSPRSGVQHDPSNAVLAGEDPIELLEIVKYRLVIMHATDRFLRPGQTLDELRQVEDSVGYAAILSHGGVGKGLNNYWRIFQIRGEVGYQGWISVEDGINGLDEIRESAEFLRLFMRS